jgi:electron transfer flavoprotein beta subunit
MSLRVVALVRRLAAAPDGGRAAAVLGQCEEAALRAGVALRAAGATLTAVTAGASPDEDDALRLALRAGADRAVRVTDASLDGIDYHGVARVLAAATRHLGFDLVVLGDRSADEAQGAVGPAVAEALGVAHVTAAIDLAIDGGAAAVTRRESGGLRRLRLALPLVVTVVRSPAPPLRLGDAAGRVEPLDFGALGLVALELRHRVACAGRASPVRGAGGATVLGRPDELIARLRDERLLP